MQPNGSEIVRATPTEVRRYEGLTMAVAPAEALRRVEELQAFVKTVMVKGVDYGPIPGTDKSILLQAGSQKLAEIYGLAPRYEFVEATKDWERNFFYFEVRCILESRRDGSHVGEGIGSCNSREGKYAYRWLFESEIPAGTKKDSLVQRTKDSRKTGRPYTQYRLPNDDIPSLVNTIMKMAMKRAHTAAVIGATRSAGIFDHDIEDLPEDAIGVPEAVRSWDQADADDTAERRAAEIRATQNFDALKFVVDQIKADMSEGRLTREEANELVGLATAQRATFKVASAPQAAPAVAQAMGGHPPSAPAAVAQAPAAVAQAQAQPLPDPPPAAPARRPRAPKPAAGSAESLFGPEPPKAPPAYEQPKPAHEGPPCLVCGKPLTVTATGNFPSCGHSQAQAAPPAAPAPIAPPAAAASPMATNAAAVAQWNATVPVGAPVTWSPPMGPPVKTTTVGAAKLMGVFAVCEVVDPVDPAQRKLAKLGELVPA